MLKKYDFCNASATFQAPHKMLSLPRLLTLCHVCAAQNAAPAKKLQNAQAQSVAPATRKRHGNIDRLPKYCAWHAARNHHRNARHKTAQNNTNCEEIQLQQLILSHFVSAAQRQEMNAIPRTAANARATVGKHRPTPRPPLINGTPSLRIREKAQKHHLEEG